MTNYFYIHLFRFYAKALSFPYTELAFELQHIFRQLEINSQNELDEQLAAHALEVLNYFQGEEMSTMQGEFGRLFSSGEDSAALVSSLFTSYGPAEVAEELLDEMFETLLELRFDEAPESIVNLMDYYSFLAETDLDLEKLTPLVAILKEFSKTLYDITIINYYKELGKSLNELSALFNPE